MRAKLTQSVLSYLLAGLLVVAFLPVAAGAQELGQAEIDAMSLPAIVTTVRARCGMMVTAMSELQRRHPDQVAEVPDCGGRAAAKDGGPYRAMSDPALNTAITSLSVDLTGLVARGEALQAAYGAGAGTAPLAQTASTALPSTPAQTNVTPAPLPPPTRELMAAVPASAGTPPVGKYYCYMGPQHTMVGRIWILPGQQYKILEDGPIGRFRIDPTSHAIAWLSGSNLKLKRRGWHLPPGLGDRLRNDVDSKRHAIIIQEEGFDKTPFEPSNWAASSFEKCYIPST